MALSNIELYEELKKTVTEDAARMIAEVVPKGDEVATKTDLALLESNLKGYIDSRITRLVLVAFVPVWLGMFACSAC
jgi:hypothetical protein